MTLQIYKNTSLCIILVLAIMLGAIAAAYSIGAREEVDVLEVVGPGDRIRMAIDPASLSADIRMADVPIGADYEIGPGDELFIQVTGRGDLNYRVGGVSGGSGEGRNLDNVVVTPSGDIILPLVGAIHAAGLTTEELRLVVAQELEQYFRNADISLAISQPRITKIWVYGDVENPGPQVLPGTATALEALLKAGIRPTGSTRQIRLTRAGQSRTIDAYAAIMNGDLEQNVTLQPGDVLFVPVARGSVEVTGEVSRPGSFEPVSFEGGECRVSDAIGLAMGLSPAAVPARVTLERKDPRGEVTSTEVNLDNILKHPECAENIKLLDGDRIRVPSIGEYQSVIRMIGEFVGEGVYQRIIGEKEEQVLAKTGVYRLSTGETAGSVVRKTGGWTPQADLKRASIERRYEGGIEVIDLDLERVLVQNDSAADIPLQNGDTLILPSALSKVQVLGEVAKPGAYQYAPGRRLIEYIGEAGGPKTRAKLSRIALVRPKVDGGSMRHVSIRAGKSVSDKDNPILEPGDIVFVPESLFHDWRDIIQLMTTYRLIQTIF